MFLQSLCRMYVLPISYSFHAFTTTRQRSYARRQSVLKGLSTYTVEIRILVLEWESRIKNSEATTTITMDLTSSPLFTLARIYTYRSSFHSPA
jgi:hypothetical protein